MVFVCIILKKFMPGSGFSPALPYTNKWFKPFKPNKWFKKLASRTCSESNGKVISAHIY